MGGAQARATLHRVGSVSSDAPFSSLPSTQGCTTLFIDTAWSSKTRAVLRKWVKMAIERFL